MKNLLSISIVAMTILSLFGCKETQANAPAPKELNLQLYSVRTLLGTPELFAQNHTEVLKNIHDMGFTGVEAASYDDGKFSGLEPEAFRQAMEDAGLKLVSSHTTRYLTKEELETGDLTEALKWWDVNVAAHKAAGFPYVVMSMAPLMKSEAELKVMVNYLNAIGEKYNAVGIKFGYHSHSHEFKKVEDAGTSMMDYLMANTDPTKVFFEMDVYWAVIAGVSPVDYMNKYPGRFTILHIKDNNEIGQSGMVGFDAIFKNFEVAGTKTFIAELEHASTPDIMKGLQESVDYLKNAPFVK